MKINIQRVGNNIKGGKGTHLICGSVFSIHKVFHTLVTEPVTRETVSYKQGQNSSSSFQVQGSVHSSIIQLNLSFSCWRSGSQKSSVSFLIYGWVEWCLAGQTKVISTGYLPSHYSLSVYFLVAFITVYIYLLNLFSFVYYLSFSLECNLHAAWFTAVHSKVPGT